MMTKLLLLAGLFSGSLMNPIISYYKLATGVQLRGLQVPVAQAAMAFVETNKGRRSKLRALRGSPIRPATPPYP